jgi:hypothetical protein
MMKQRIHPLAIDSSGRGTKGSLRHADEIGEANARDDEVMGIRREEQTCPEPVALYDGSPRFIVLSCVQVLAHVRHFHCV